MTSKEKRECEALLIEGIRRADLASIKYGDARLFSITNDRVRFDLTMSVADQNFGMALGIYQVLTALKFEHTRMEELAYSVVGGDKICQ